MANFGGWFLTKLKRLLIYIIGGIVILAILAVGGFYMAAPYLNSFVSNELNKHGVKADQSDVSVMGNINLKNVTLPTPEGISVTIGAISGRPPVSVMPGSFTIHDLDLKRENIQVHIPEMTLDGIVLKDKDTTIESHVLQALMRVGLSSVNAPNIEVSLTGKNGATEKLMVKGFWLSGLKNGAIGSVGIAGMNTNIDLAAQTSDNNDGLQLVGQSSAMEARDIDIGYAYSILAGKIKPDNVGRTVVGPVQLGDIVINLFEGKSRHAHFALSTFKTSGLKMHPMQNIPEELAKTYLAAKKSGDEKAEKAARNALIITVVSAITSVDAEIEKADIDLPNIKAKLNSFKLSPREWNQPVPESLLVSLDNLSLNTAEMPQKSFAFLSDLGYQTLDLSGKIDFAYDPSKKTLALNTISFDAKDIGSGEMSAKIINVDSKLFSGDKDATSEAANQIGVVQANMRYSDYGFIDKIFGDVAVHLSKNHDALKKELYQDLDIIMTQSPILLLKNHDEAQKLSKAFGDFAMKPGTIKISIKAKDANGLTATDLDSALKNELSSVLNKVDLTVENQ